MDILNVDFSNVSVKFPPGRLVHVRIHGIKGKIVHWTWFGGGRQRVVMEGCFSD